MNFFSAWNDYYQPQKITTIIKNENFSSANEKLNITSGNSYIYNCYFHDMTAYDAGAIFYETPTSYLLVEKCSFLNCSSDHYTAAIRVRGGNCVLAFICGQKCKSDLNDGFCSVSYDSLIEINSIYDSSISSCQTNGSHINYHEKGMIHVKSVNLSHNSAVKTSALCCIPSKYNKQTKIGSDISYCSLSNNTATNEQCIRLNGEINASTCFQIMYSNIVNNNANNTIYSRGKTEIIGSCILNNLSPCFYTSGSSSKITLFRCNADITEKTGSANVQESEIAYPFINVVTFFETGNCKNLFVQDQFKSKCQTQYQRNLIPRKVLITFLFFLLI